jgi:hypothetical protein
MKGREREESNALVLGSWLSALGAKFFRVACNVMCVGVASMTRSCLINSSDRGRSASSGAKAQLFLELNVGAKAPTPKKHLRDNFIASETKVRRGIRGGNWSEVEFGCRWPRSSRPGRKFKDCWRARRLRYPARQLRWAPPAQSGWRCRASLLNDLFPSGRSRDRNSHRTSGR